MADSSEKITLVVATNNHYLIMLAALLKSIELNHKNNELIDVWIISRRITKKNKKNLEDSLDRGIFSITWISEKEVIPGGMQLPLDKNTYPPNIFMRLFIPYFLPRHIKKALYLDVDMIVNEDIAILWNTNIENYVVGAVTDSFAVSIGNYVANYKELNLPADAKYFNSGLLLINLDNWRDNDITLKVIDTVNKNRKDAEYSDQYGLNVNLVGQWLELDPLWNYLAKGDHPNPYIIHFIHRKPFYKSYFNNIRYKEKFYYYLNQTKWANSSPVGELCRYLVKTGNVIEKIPLFIKHVFRREQ